MTAAAFATLLLFMVAHALLETARDALFLARIPAERLPWVYLLIAGLALVVTQLQGRFEHKLGSRRQIGSLFLFSAVVTGVLWLILGGEHGSVRALYAVYVWTGLLATMALIQFWVLMSDLFTASQAKRLFAVIGTGSVIGAIIGSGAASLLATQVPARHMLLAAAVALVLTGIVSMVGLRHAPDAERAREERGGSGRAAPRQPDFLASCAAVWSQAYPRRVALLVMASTVALTFADFLFKRTVAAHVDPDQLGAFFAMTYFGLNVASLLVQVGLVGILVRRLPLRITLSVLPALLLLGGASLFVVGGAAAAILVKGPDGALRHSLHRTASELLYVPISSRHRRYLKGVIDVIGQRGGQALGSLAILGALTALTHDLIPLALAGGLIALSFAWIALSFELEEHYFDLFRTTLREGVFESQAALPELDVSSLESWIAALDSAEDRYVLAALDLLSREGKVDLIPRLILYHPSLEVVERALSAFVDAGRDDFVAVADRVFERATPLVRAALLRSRSAVEPDEGVTRALLESHPDCPMTAATGLVVLLVNGWATAADREALERLVARQDAAEQYAVARAIRYTPHADAAYLLARLAQTEAVEVLAEVTQAIGALADPALLPHLLLLLNRRQLTDAASDAIVGLGPGVLSRLDEAMRDPELPETVRARLPGVIARLDPESAARVLLVHLVEDGHDGMVRLKVLKALEQLRRYHPEVRLERRTLEAALERTVRDAYRWMGLHESLARGAREMAQARDPRVHSLLLRLLDGKEQHAVDRALRLLGLIHVSEDVSRIRRGLQSPLATVRSSSRELLEKLVGAPLRDALVGLVDDADRATRLASAGSFAPGTASSVAQALEECLSSSSVALRSLAASCVEELGLGPLDGNLRTLAREPSSRLEALVERAIHLVREVTGAPEVASETPPKPARKDLAYET